MHTVKDTNVELSLKKCHIYMYFKTKTVVAHAVWCWAQCHIFSKHSDIRNFAGNSS